MYIQKHIYTCMCRLGWKALDQVFLYFCLITNCKSQRQNVWDCDLKSKVHFFFTAFNCDLAIKVCAGLVWLQDLWMSKILLNTFLNSSFFRCDLEAFWQETFCFALWAFWILSVVLILNVNRLLKVISDFKVFCFSV